MRYRENAPMCEMETHLLKKLRRSEHEPNARAIYVNRLFGCVAASDIATKIFLVECFLSITMVTARFVTSSLTQHLSGSIMAMLWFVAATAIYC